MSEPKPGSGLGRRAFSSALLRAVGSYALLRSLFGTAAFAAAVRPIAEQWLRGVQQVSADLGAGAITPGLWQDRIAELHRRVSLDELLRLIDFDRLVRGFEYPARGVRTRRVSFPPLAGLPERLAFHPKLFGMRRDRAIIPHGHRNMASCHYVLRGELWLRQYDKLEEDATHMLIRPTVDEAAPVGSHSSISDERDNVHWLRATSETAFTFDVIVLDLAGRPWEVDNIDPRAAQTETGGLLRVRKLDVDEALRRYGHETHHR